jgi:hypothetical protein
MNKWQNIDDNRRIFIIENIADKTKLSPDALECYPTLIENRRFAQLLVFIF